MFLNISFLLFVSLTKIIFLKKIVFKYYRLINIKIMLYFIQGEYRTKYLGLTRCSSIQSLDKIIFNLYLSKTSINTTEVKGNITNCIAIDDSLNVSNFLMKRYIHFTIVYMYFLYIFIRC